jgi:hypothetical protein
LAEPNSDETGTLVLRRALIVLAGLGLILGSGFLAVGWLGVWDSSSSRVISPNGQRALVLVFLWPITGLVVWLLGGMALLARRRYAAAGWYTLAVFAAIVAIPTIFVILPVIFPFFEPIRLAYAPGWIGALFFLAVDAAVIYLAWTKLFASDFVKRRLT